jgi:hypothetical protein
MLHHMTSCIICLRTPLQLKQYLLLLPGCSLNPCLHQPCLSSLLQRWQNQSHCCVLMNMTVVFRASKHLSHCNR